ncbi:MAG: multicopper oxidase domain-containing protein [Vulcanococcus sp.]|uniref:multicopper oxidase domain-containing protein n=1 Tax=Vulcanococcus sp. TaxID=2856995 RepID=UPI0025F96A59|nr:multicopper oxidase domain-containing protein [Vulcanococcus sp.]MBW0166987.1 multicopper oxidase domain-containing protein [Vulcanococcus sp.]
MPGSSFVPQSLRGGFFPKYYVYDGGPDDEDGFANGILSYTTYFGNGPFHIDGISSYIRNVLGLQFPDNANTRSDLLYSFEDINNQGKDFYSPVYLYSYGHKDPSGSIHFDSPGAHLALDPGQTLKLTTKFSSDVKSIGKHPATATSGVAFMESGGAGSTNTHYHGLNTSPKGYGDNVDIENREDYINSIKVPKSHHEGLSWWHPHFHGSANGQVYGGAFGNLQIGDSLYQLPGFESAKRNFIGIKNFNVTYNQQTARFEVVTSGFTPEETARNIYLINGEYLPIKAGFTTGEWNSFSFINYTSNSFLNAKIVKTIDDVSFDIKDKSTWGEVVDLYIYGKDGYQTPTVDKAYTGINNTILNGLQLEDPVGTTVTDLPSPNLENNLYLSPARRYETLAYFTEPGDYKIISEAWTGAGLRAGGWIWPDIELGTISVTGSSVAAPSVLPSDVTPERPYESINLDLASYQPLRDRRITWSGDSFVEGPNRFRKINGGIYNTNTILKNGEPNRYAGYNPPFLINDNVLPYNPALITQLDSLEYWHQENWATEQHPFHPHQNHFQIVPTTDAPQERMPLTAPIGDSPATRDTIILFVTYLGRIPTPDELSQYSAQLSGSLTRQGLAKILSSSDKYQAEFSRFYVDNRDLTKDRYQQIADGAFYTITRENIYDVAKSQQYARLLKKVGVEQFPLALLDRLTAGASGEVARQRLDNLATAALYAVNKVAQTQPFTNVATALLRVLNQQITDNDLSVDRILPLIDQLVDYDPSNVTNGEAYEGSPVRMDNVALPAGLIQEQSFSSPSSNRYPTPAIYNKLDPGRITTATTFDNYTGGFLQHCHILPHEDSGQGMIVKIIDNMQRSWFSTQKEFAPGQAIEVYRSSSLESRLINSDLSSSRRIAFGDVDKDGYSDIIVVNGDGGSDLVAIVDGRTLEPKYTFSAFSDYELGQTLPDLPSQTSWKHGLYVDVNDVTGDGLSDIVLGAGTGGGNRLRVFTRVPDGIQFSGETQAFSSSPEYANISETRFKIGDFDADNFSDIAFIGNQQDGSPIEVRSTRSGTVLSLFKPGLEGRIGLSAGYSSYHNLGLETLYMYQADHPDGVVKAATMRAAKYVAHSRLADNPYYDAAKYYGYEDADEQTLLTKPVGKIRADLGFNWLLADQFSLAESLPQADPITGASYSLEAGFLGYLANPVLIASSGSATDILNYTTQTTRARLPFFSTNSDYASAAKDVIGLFVSNLGRLPSPFELHRLANRVVIDGKSLSYVEDVITYKGSAKASNQVSMDAISDQYYDHDLGDFRYAYQGVSDLRARSSYRLISDDSSGSGLSYESATLNNIKNYGLYLDAQLVNNMNLDGDIFMYLGESPRLRRLLFDSFRSIDPSPQSLSEAKRSLDQVLSGNYSYPLGESSPLANGLNVDGSSYSSSFTQLHPSLLDSSSVLIADASTAHHHHH